MSDWEPLKVIELRSDMMLAEDDMTSANVWNSTIIRDHCIISKRNVSSVVAQSGLT